MPTDPGTLLGMRILLLLGVSVVATLLLQKLRCPGGRGAAAVLGGLLAGACLGPGVLGMAAPDFFERVFRGGAEVRQTIEETRRRHQDELRALLDTGVTPVAVAEQTRIHEQELAALQADLAAAQRRARRGVDLAAVTILGCGVCAAGWARRPLRAVSADDLRGAAAGGLMAGAIAGGISAVVLLRLLGVPMQTAAPVGAALAGGSWYSGLASRWVGWAGRAPLARLMNAVTLAGAAAVVAWFVPRGQAWVVAGPILAAFAGVLLSRLHALGRPGRDAARVVVFGLSVPMLAATAANAMDPMLVLSSGAWIAAVVASLLLAGDGHLVGTWLGLGAAGVPTDRLGPLGVGVEAQSLGVAPTQLGWACVLLAADVIDPASVAGSGCLAVLLAHTVLPEALLGVNRRTLRLLGDVGVRGDQPGT